MKPILIRWIKILIIVYCLAGIAIYYLQDYLLFRPEAVNRNYKYDFPLKNKEVNIPYTSRSNINIIQFLPAVSPPKGVVLYFHGNKMNISRYSRYSGMFTSNGYEVWMIDYPGYGKSTGDFTEQQLYDWALLLYKLARVHYSRDSIIIYGKSMGTGIAAQLASVRDCRNLILETPYYNFPSIIGSYAFIYPVNNMIRFKIPTWQFLQQVTAPVNIFHGTNDWIIPLRNARKLIPFLKPSDQFTIIENGRHNDLPDFPVFLQKLDSLLK